MTCAAAAKHRIAAATNFTGFFGPAPPKSVMNSRRLMCFPQTEDHILPHHRKSRVAPGQTPDEEHNATPATVAVIFGDVRTTDQAVALFNAGPNARDLATLATVLTALAMAGQGQTMRRPMQAL
jgi:hypothetical protein